VLRIQNSIDEEAVLIEKINMLQVNNNNELSSIENSDPNSLRRPNSRQGPMSESQLPSPDTFVRELQQSNNNDGILRMSPRSQTKFFDSLNKIFEE